MIKILSIGNSFSVDGQRWLYDIAVSAGDELLCVNLHIGGCTLERHCNNILTNAEDYFVQRNGIFVGERTTLYEGLLSDEWDVVTVQQASGLSGRPQSYFPYLKMLVDFVRLVRPDARIFIQQTWSYDPNSNHPDFVNYNCDCEEMFRRLKDAYDMASVLVDAPLIRSGEFIQFLRLNTEQFSIKNGGMSINCDGFHLTQLYGRYAVGLMWYHYLCDGDIAKVDFIPEENGECADRELIDVIKNAAKLFLKDGI